MTMSPRRAATRPFGAWPTRVLAVGGAGLVAAVLATSTGAFSAGRSNHAATRSAMTSSRTTDGFLTSEVGRHSTVQLTEDGSSLLYPLYQAWVTGYAKTHRGFSSTAGADGSGTGIADAENGTTDFGGSDAYLPAATFKQYPTIENVPVAVSSQMINYNLGKGFAKTHLKLSGPVIAKIYEGKIRNWDSKQIKSLNRGVKLPNLKIVPVHRSDSSGDSFLFTSYLAFSDPGSFAGKQGPSTDPTWPSVSGALAAKGNSGMVAQCASAKGCIAYIGISYKKDTSGDNLGIAALRNKKGKYVAPNAKSITAEAASFPKVPANGAISMIYGPAKTGYPIINYEYVVLKTSHSGIVGKTMKSFLTWSVSSKHGNSPMYLGAVNFRPLSKAAVKVSTKLISKIK